LCDERKRGEKGGKWGRAEVLEPLVKIVEGKKIDKGGNTSVRLSHFPGLGKKMSADAINGAGSTEEV